VIKHFYNASLGGNKRWQATTSATPPYNGAYGIAYGAGVFVMLPPSGYTSYHSTDAVTWTQGGYLPYSRAWSGIWFLNGQFVATQQTSGSIVTSPDGYTWTDRGATQAHGGGCLAYGSGLYVQPVSTAGYTSTTTYSTSPDAITWTSQSFGSYYYINVLTYGNGLFVGLGGNGTNSFAFTSSNGTSWTTTTLSSPVSLFGANNIAYGNGVYVAVGTGGNIIVSSNGTSWSEISLPTGYYTSQIVFANGYFVTINAASTTYYFTSPDGYTWTKQTIASAFAGAGNGCYGNNSYVFPGNTNTIIIHG
jgi:hypothetical protein